MNEPIKITITADHLTIKDFDLLHEDVQQEINDILNGLKVSIHNVQKGFRTYKMIYGHVEERYQFLFEVTNNYDVELI